LEAPTARLMQAGGSLLSLHRGAEFPEFLLPQQMSGRSFSRGQLIRFLDAVEHSKADASRMRFGFVLS
jgi:hypothetical protein